LIQILLRGGITVSSEHHEIQNGGLEIDQDEDGRVRIGNVVPGISRGDDEPTEDKVVGRVVQPEHPLTDVVAKVIRAAQQVYQELGPGFELDIYDRALALELAGQKLTFSQGENIDIYYRGKKVGRTAVAFVVEAIIVELKVESDLADRAVLQTSSHLRASPYDIALLLNFGAEELEYAQISAEDPGH
jgi:GxxExxY protein